MTRIAYVLTAAVLLGAVAPAQAATPLTRAEARRAAVRATAQTCKAVPWCNGYEVVPARQCRRGTDGVVSCTVWFLTERKDRCGGVVSVKRGRAGRLDLGMAVPSNCAAGSAPAQTG